MKKLFSLLIVALCVTMVSMAADVTVTKTVDELVAENNFTISEGNTATCYPTLELDDVVTVSTSGEPNCGSIWGAENAQWRLYQAKKGDITIAVAEGYSLKSIKLTYVTTNDGILVDGPETDVVAEVSGASITYVVGNASTKTNGQVRITGFEVVYHLSTGLDNVEFVAPAARKIVENGQIYILRDGVRYNIFGAVVE